MKDTIVRTSLYTFAIFFGTLAYGMSIFGLLFPQTMANLNKSLGAHNGAAMFYERMYRANPTTENMYRALDRFIIAQNHNRVIYFFEKFENRDDSQSVINTVNQHGMNQATNDVQRVMWGNELNRLKTAYINALLQTSRVETARTTFIGWMKNVDVNQPNLSFEAFIANNKVNASLRASFSTYRDNFIAITGTEPDNVLQMHFVEQSHWLLLVTG